MQNPIELLQSGFLLHCFPGTCTLFGTVFHILPILLPLFSPCKWSIADWASLGWQFRFLHIPKSIIASKSLKKIPLSLISHISSLKSQILLLASRFSLLVSSFSFLLMFPKCLFPRHNGQIKYVLPWWQRTSGMWGKHTGRVIGFVKIQNHKIT